MPPLHHPSDPTGIARCCVVALERGTRDVPRLFLAQRPTKSGYREQQNGPGHLFLTNLYKRLFLPKEVCLEEASLPFLIRDCGADMRVGPADKGRILVTCS